MRQAVIEGLEWIFSLPPTARLSQTQLQERLKAAQRGRGMIGRRELLQSGGQLEIAGKIVARYDGASGGGRQHNNVNNNRPSQPKVELHTLCLTNVHKYGLASTVSAINTPDAPDPTHGTTFPTRHPHASPCAALQVGHRC